MKEDRKLQLGGEINFREADEAERKVSGYAAIFNSEARLAEILVEKIAPGAFKSSMQNDVRALWGHDTNKIIGRTTNGTLKLEEDERGLRFDLILPDTVDGKDAFTLIKRGDVTGVSFGFRVKKDQWEKGEEGKPHVRTLLDVDLLEISPCAFPAYEDTSVSARSALELIKEKEVEWAHEQREKQRESVAKMKYSLDLLSRMSRLDALMQ